MRRGGVSSWTGLGLAACHFLDRQILDWVRVMVMVRVAVQELTVQELTVQELSGSHASGMMISGERTNNML